MDIYNQIMCLLLTELYLVAQRVQLKFSGTDLETVVFKKTKNSICINMYLILIVCFCPHYLDMCDLFGMSDKALICSGMCVSKQFACIFHEVVFDQVKRLPISTKHDQLNNSFNPFKMHIKVKMDMRPYFIYLMCC